MVLQALQAQLAAALRDQMKDVLLQLSTRQAPLIGTDIVAIPEQPLLATAPALAFGRLDEQVARRQSIVLEDLRRELSVDGCNRVDDRRRHPRLLAATEEQQ